MTNSNLQRVDRPPAEADAVPECLSRAAGFLLNRTARIIKDQVTEALVPLRLSPRDVGMLRILADEGPLTQQALGKRHDIDRTTVVQMVDELESRNLVERVRNLQDRRSHLIHLTPRGKKTLAQALRLTDKVQSKFLEPLSETEWEELRTTLLKLLNSHHPAQS